MTEPSERALRKACEILGGAYVGWRHQSAAHSSSVANLARHLDAEDKAAREALGHAGGYIVTRLADFTRRHILPDPRPTLRSILLDESLNVDAKEQAIRDAGMLKETDCD